MNWLNTVKVLLGRKAVRGGLLLLALAVVAGVLINIKNAPVEEAAEDKLPLVSLTSAQGYAGQSTINLIGTVRAFSEAAVTAEKAGRVTSVLVGLGDTVTAGSIIATVENAAEQASVLQAQGVYEGAVAAAAQSGVSVETAQNNLNAAIDNAQASLSGAYNTTNGVLLNTINQFYRNPNGTYPSLQISTNGNAAVLSSSLVDVRARLETWGVGANTSVTSANIDSLRLSAQADIAATLNIVDLLLNSVQNADKDNELNGLPLSSYSTELTSARGTLTTLSNSLQTAETSIRNAEQALAQAQLGSTGGATSAADAQVKQALGSLRAAQANLAKTIIRTPITGTVNALSIRTGDFVNSFAQVAEVANNNALEVVTYVGETDRSAITVGETVVIEDQFEGIITEIAPAVDTATGKTEVRVASESDVLQNGDSVSITKQVAETLTTKVIIPLSAVKFQITDGAVFILEDNVLTLRSVTLGTVRGGSVEILDGLTASEQFVADARGLVEGTKVEIISKSEPVLGIDGGLKPSIQN